MLTWPHPHSDWAPWLSQCDQLYCQIVKTISAYEKLLIVSYDQQHQNHIRTLLNHHAINQARVRFHMVTSNDSWARDHGPITVLKDGRPCLLDFGFNGWGGKFSAALDDLISQKLYTQGAFANIDMEAWPLILEGGSIDSDGEGTLLTTEQCLLTPTRNPALDKSQVESVLKNSLGIERILWLSKGELIGDDTDSHIDMLARFCDRQTIAYTSCENVADPHYASLKDMQQQLAGFKTAQGTPYTLIPLPIPKAIYNDQGERLPASYANFLIINKAVLVPVYGDNNDAIALQRLAACFPDRKLIGINCRTLIEQFGSLHCISMQLPKGVFSG
jgi:agmatine/peptidylarginine deiminase